MQDIPRIISVDDHVVEPPDLWSSRLPARYADRGPRIVRQKIRFVGDGAGGSGALGWVAPGAVSTGWPPGPTARRPAAAGRAADHR